MHRNGVKWSRLYENGVSSDDRGFVSRLKVIGRRLSSWRCALTQVARAVSIFRTPTM